VVRGDAPRILEQHSDFKCGQLPAIRRKRKAEYRKGVELAAQKRPLEAFVHDELPGAGGNLWIGGRKIGAGDLQINGRGFTGLVFGVQESCGLRPVIGMQTLLFARQFIMDVIPSALFAAVESESLFHGCVIHSDDFTADDFDSGRGLV
jgi:hypothetical protein